jgi:hypothetical protein
MLIRITANTNEVTVRPDNHTIEINPVVNEVTVRPDNHTIEINPVVNEIRFYATGVYAVQGSGSPAPTGEHNDLTGRDAEDAHPISAITNLQGELDDKADADSLAAVATSGSYNDLLDTPTPSDKRTEWVSLALMYQGFAPQGSVESDAVWTIYKIVTLATGGVVSNTEYTDKKWTERSLL